MEVKSKESFQKLNDDEKNDLVGQEVELVQTEIDQVMCVTCVCVCLCVCACVRMRSLGRQAKVLSWMLIQYFQTLHVAATVAAVLCMA